MDEYENIRVDATDRHGNPGIYKIEHLGNAVIGGKMKVWYINSASEVEINWVSHNNVFYQHS